MAQRQQAVTRDMESSLTLSFVGRIILVGALAHTAAAAEFSFEATGGYTNAETTFTERDQYGTSITWFIAPVDESKGPLAEAAFLSRSSSMSYGYSHSENSFAVQRFGPFPIAIPEPMESDLDFELVPSPTRFPIAPSPEPRPEVSGTTEIETNTHSFNTRYVVAGTPWIVSSSIRVTDGSFSAGNLSSDQDDWSGALSLGRYLFTNTALTVRGQYGENKSTTESILSLNFPIFNINQIAQLTSELEVETIDIALIGEHLGTVGVFNYQVTVDASYLATESDVINSTLVTDAITDEIVSNAGLDITQTSIGTVDGWQAGLSGTWYLTNRFGINANYRFTDLENQKINGYGGGLSLFVTRKLEVRASYAKSDFEGAFNDLDQWGLTLRGRF